uniref:Coenzyme Q-binding protein COQ10, mitochondrial n=1 Tax=Anthurium amnicola TaxID=1678845 RepID=A0A1D1YUM5_9ARAE
MPMLLSASRAARGLLSRRRHAPDLRNGLARFDNCGEGVGKLGSFARARYLGGLARIGGAPTTGRLINLDAEANLPPGNSRNAGQTRWFLGCGDGEEGNVLSKNYEERRVIGYSPEQLFAVVAAVDLYEDFVPWCQRSKIICRNNDGSFDAELEIGFKFLVESYISHVELKKPKYIKTTVTESGLFEYLINVWEFNPGPIPGSCDLYFLVDFKFQSPLYRQVASMFFKEVVSRLVGSFSDRCCRIYGPGVQVLENPYEHRI